MLGLELGDIDEELSNHPGKYWVEYEAGGSTFSISNAWEPSGQSGPTASFEVVGFDASVARLKQSDVKIVAERIESPVCCFDLIEDPDGNSITIYKWTAVTVPCSVEFQGPDVPKPDIIS